MGIIKYGIAAAILAGATAAGATSLPIGNSGTLQSGSFKAASCQPATETVSVNYAADSSGVYLGHVEISGVDQACAGKWMTVLLLDKNGQKAGPAQTNAYTSVQLPATLSATAADNVFAVGYYGVTGVTADYTGAFANIMSQQVDHAVVTFSDIKPA